jgi:hypothetical protein
MITKRSDLCVFLPKLRPYLVLLILAAGVASATTVAAGSGTLSFTETTTDAGTCLDKFGEEGPIYNYTFTNFSYTLSGTTTPLSGEDVEVLPLPGGGGCPAPKDPPISWAFNGYEVVFTPAGTSGHATVQAIVNPAYKVVSVLYSPPGNQSSQGYTNTTTNGTTTTIGSSFSFTEQLTFSAGIPNVLAGGGSVGWSESSSFASAFTQTWTDATSVATDDNSNTTYNPTKSDAVNHNLDTLAIWLNPQVTVTWSGATPTSYTTGSQATSGVSAIVDDIILLPAVTMEATPPGAAGVTTVPVGYLIPQAIAGENGVNSYMPGLGAICKNTTLYQEQLAADLANPADPPAICTQTNQCGCAPSDFVNILQTDPLLNYSGTTYSANPYAGTESPLELDASGASVCGEDPVPTTANCRYEIVPAEKGSSTTQFEPLSGSDSNTFAQSDATNVTDTIGGTTSWSVGITFGGGPIFANLKTTDTWTWTDSQSTGNSSGTGNTMTVTLKTSTADCVENVNIYEDVEYHTYAFQVPTGITTCP